MQHTLSIHVSHPLTPAPSSPPFIPGAASPESTHPPLALATNTLTPLSTLCRRASLAVAHTHDAAMTTPQSMFPSPLRLTPRDTFFPLLSPFSSVESRN